MITLNGINWNIELVNPYNLNLFRNDGSLTIGMCDADKKSIFISNNLSFPTLWDVLIHELTHASLFSYGYNLNKICHEELIANFVAQHGAEVIDTGRRIYEQLISNKI